MDLKVNYVILFITFLVEKHKSAVIQVERNHAGLIAHYAPPYAARIAVGMYAVNHHRRTGTGRTAYGGQLVGKSAAGNEPCHEAAAAAANHVGKAHGRQGRTDALDARLAASGTEICAVSAAGIVEVDNERGLHAVGKPEAQLAHLALHHAQAGIAQRQVVVGVIGIMLVDDIAHHAVGPRRLHAKAAAMAHAAQPHKHAPQLAA